MMWGSCFWKHSLPWGHNILIFSSKFRFSWTLAPAWLTRHFVEQSFSCAIIRLQVFTIQRPVNVRNETEGLVAFSNLLISLGNRIDVDWAVVGSHCEIRAIWRKFHFMNDFFSIFDMNHFCHISIRIKSKAISSKSRTRNLRSCIKVHVSEKKKCLKGRKYLQELEN